MDSFKFLSTRMASFILYLIPLIYSFLVFFIGFMEYKQRKTFNLLVFSVFYGIVILFISIVGCQGIIKENATQIRSTIVLLIVNNIIMTILVTFLLIDILNFPHIVTIHNASKFLQYIVKNKRVGLFFCSFVYLLIFFSFCFMWTVGDYMAYLDARLCLDDLGKSHDFLNNKKKKKSESNNSDESEFLIRV